MCSKGNREQGTGNREQGAGSREYGVERASWWNGHLGGTGILPVTISREAGCPLYSYSARRFSKPIHSAPQECHSETD